MLLGGCEFAQGVGERAVRFGRVDGELHSEVRPEQVVLGEAEVEQYEVLCGLAWFGAHDRSGAPTCRGPRTSLASMVAPA